MNLQAEWLRQSVGYEKALLIRYEEFMLQTPAVLARLGNFAGVEFTDVERCLNGGAGLYFSHTIAGNRVRMKGELKLKIDQEWIQKLSARDQYTTAILAGWLMARYGY